MNTIYYIIIFSIAILIIGLLVARAIHNFHRNIDDTLKLLRSTAIDLEVLAGEIKEINSLVEEKNMLLDDMTKRLEEYNERHNKGDMKNVS